MSMKKPLPLLILLLGSSFIPTVGDTLSEAYRYIQELVVSQCGPSQQHTRGDLREALEALGEGAVPALIEATHYGQILMWTLGLQIPPHGKAHLSYRIVYKGGYKGDQQLLTSIVAAFADGHTLKASKTLENTPPNPLGVGHILTVNIVLENDQPIIARDVIVIDVLYEGFRYLPNSTRISQSMKAPDPTIRDAAWIRWDMIYVLQHFIAHNPEAMAVAIPALISRATQDTNSHPRWFSIAALSMYPEEIKTKEIIPHLLRIFRENRDHTVILNTSVVLANFGRPEAIPVLHEALDSTDPFRRWEAIFCLRIVHNEETVALLSRIVVDLKRTKAERQEAANTLGAIADPRAIPALLKALKDPEPGVRWRAAVALLDIGDAKVIPAIREALAVEKDPTAIKQLQYVLKEFEKQTE